MLKLYEFPLCPYCQKVRVALEEKGVEYERIFVDIRGKEQKRPSFLAMNPKGKVPVLIDDGLIVYESTIINEYLDEKYGAPRLMPETPEGRAQARLWIDFAEGVFNEPWAALHRQIRLTDESERDESLIQESRAELTKALKVLDSALEGKDFLAGDYSLADSAFTPRIGAFDSLGIEIGGELKNVGGWIGRIKMRKSYTTLMSR